MKIKLGYIINFSLMKIKPPLSVSSSKWRGLRKGYDNVGYKIILKWQQY